MFETHRSQENLYIDKSFTRDLGHFVLTNFWFLDEENDEDVKSFMKRLMGWRNIAKSVYANIEHKFNFIDIDSESWYDPSSGPGFDNAMNDVEMYIENQNYISQDEIRDSNIPQDTFDIIVRKLKLRETRIYVQNFHRSKKLNKRIGMIEAMLKTLQELQELYVIMIDEYNGAQNVPGFTNRGPLKPTQRFDILRRDSYRCQICGKSAQDEVILEVDHIIPVSRGGDNNDANLQTLCFECNRGKSTKDL